MNTGKHPSHSRGAVLLALMVLLLLAGFGTWVMAQKIPRPADPTLAELKAAKAALLAYAIGAQEWQSSQLSLRYAKVRLGELPCPDFNNDGQINPVDDYQGAHCKSLLGRLPWRTLRLPQPRAGQIWYALAAEFANLSGALAELEPAINPDTATALKLDNHAVAAVLLHSGTPFAAQRHIAHNQPSDRAFYLEAANANADFKTFVSQASGDFNDTVIAISRAEILNHVAYYAASALAERLNQQFKISGAYPSPAPNFGAHCQASGDFIPQDCNHSAGDFHLPSQTASNSVDGWVFRNGWARYFRYQLPSANHARLSTRHPLLDDWQLDLINGVQQ